MFRSATRVGGTLPASDQKCLPQQRKRRSPKILPRITGGDGKIPSHGQYRFVSRVQAARWLGEEQLPMAFWQRPPIPPTKLGRYRTLSPLAGLHVSPLQLGAMSIGDKWGPLGMGTMDKELSFKLLDAYFDTAVILSILPTTSAQDESSESFIGEWAEKRGIRDQLVISTKYTTNFKDRNNAIANKINYFGNNIKSMHISVDASLKKFRTTYIDILYVHWRVMDGLHNLVVQGKVLYLGVSDTPAWIVSQANQYANDHGKSPFVIYEGAWNVMERSFEREILPMARVHGLALAPWNGRTFAEPSWERTEDQKKISRALEKVAAEVGAKSITAGIFLSVPYAKWWFSFAHRSSQVPYCFPIIGGRKIEHLLSNIEALDISLSNEQMHYLESIIPFDPGFPSVFIGDGTTSWPLLVGAAGVIDKQPSCNLSVRRKSKLTGQNILDITSCLPEHSCVFIQSYFLGS
ncbi:NADP-dependent oxidoreductase domain-containing protein [Mycena olivaceomarginata]|nr:NADP-dependent oxidoreductase domain-containing protein [Mycena olivaceomarginata]